jgi:hypothetical protein
MEYKLRTYEKGWLFKKKIHQMTTLDKLRIHNIKLKATLGYGIEMWVVSKSENRGFEPGQMKFLIRGCIQKFPDWLPGARTTNGTALCH